MKKDEHWERRKRNREAFGIYFNVVKSAFIKRLREGDYSDWMIDKLEEWNEENSSEILEQLRKRPI